MSKDILEGIGTTGLVSLEEFAQPPQGHMKQPSELSAATGEIIRERRNQLGITQSLLATRVRKRDGGSFSQQALQAIESGKTRRSSYLPSIAAELGLDLDALRRGFKKTARIEDNAAPLYSTAREIPVIALASAGKLIEAIQMNSVYDADEWVYAPRRVGPKAFAVRIDGISMLDRFGDGDKVVIDPDQEWLNGDYVLARRRYDNGSTFKQLRIEDGEHYLYALNPDWKPRIMPLDGEWEIVGKAVSKVEDL